MAVIINIDESIKRSGFNILQEPITMILENETEKYEQGSILPKIYVMKKTDVYQEEYRSSTAMGNFRPTEDLEPANLTDFEDSFGKTFRTQIWTNSFAISKQTIEDKQRLTLNGKAHNFVKTYGRTRELYGIAMLAGALSDNIVFSGKKFDTTGMDTTNGEIDGPKRTYFHNTHLSVIPDTAPQSNKFRGSINLYEDGAHEKLKELVGKVATEMQNYYDDKGNILTINPTRIVAPNHYLFKDVLMTTLGSGKTADMGGNAKNIQAGEWELIFTPYLNNHTGFTEADQAFVMIDPSANVERYGAVWFDRTPLEIESYYDKRTKANIWDGRARYGAAFGDFRAMAYVSTKILGEGEDLNTVAAAQNATPITTSDRIKKVKVTNAEDFHEEEG